MIDSGWFLEIALRSAAVASLALLAAGVLRGRSAAQRSSVLHGGLLAMAVLPLAMAWAPRWELAVPVLPARAGIETSALRAVAQARFAPGGDATPAAPRNVPIAAPPATRLDPATLLGLAWALPALALLMALAMSLSRLRALYLRARPLRDARWDAALQEAKRRSGTRGHVELLHAGDIPSPLSWGARRRIIVLDADGIDPAGAAPLLAHELAHLARQDWLKLLFARGVTALFWFNPLAWWLARQCHQVREEAADDAVLRGRVAGVDYAELLLGVARRHRVQPMLAAHAMFAGRGAMAHLSQRLARLLDDARPRTPALRGWSFGCTLAALVVTLPVAAVVPKAVERAAPAAGANATVASSTTASARATAATHASSTATAIATASTPAARASASASRVAFLVAPRPGNEPGHVQLGIEEFGGTRRSSWSSGIALSELQGLGAAALAGTQPVAFRLVRPAGRFDCEGTAREGHATGFCEFVADAAFSRELEKRGIGRPDLRTQRLLALQGARFDVLDELQRQGYGTPTLERYVEIAIHGVDVPWLRALAGAGYHLDDVRKLVEFRIHDIDAAYIDGLARAGQSALSPDEVLQFRIHDVTGDSIRALERAGVTAASRRELLDLHIHDVTPEFAAAMRDAGYADEGARRLIEFAIHGVDPAFVRELAAAGYAGLPSRQLIDFAIHDVTPRFVQELAAAGYADLPAKQLIDFAIHGVTPRLVQELAAAGQADLPPERLVEFAIHDVTPEFVRQITALGYTGADPDDLVALRIHDLTPAWIRAQLAGAGRQPSLQSLVERRIQGE